MAMTVDDDHWPSLAPIRTSSTPTACPPILQEGCCTLRAHGGHGAVCCTAPNRVSSKSLPTATSSVPSAASCCCDACASSQPGCSKASDRHTDLVRQSSCCLHTSKKTCIDFFSCFSCSKRTSSPACPRRRCTRTCMRKNGHMLRSMASFFPSGGSIQSFYSSPTGKAAQLSGAFPRLLSAGKYIASPRTPAANHSLSGKIQHFSSPRTPGSRNLQSLSAPRTPSSSKLENFSGAIASPRTPFGSGAASPSSARRRKPSLFMPPNATADKKKATDHLEEPTSPQVTCIGRVRRQSHCKKPHLKDIITPHARRHDTNTAHKKGTYSKKTHSDSGLSRCRSISSNEAPASWSVSKLSTMEACKQKLGRNQLSNLHKINGFGDECDNADNPDQQGAIDCHQGIANGNLKDLMHLNHGRRPCFFNSVECINGNLRILQEADDGMSENISMHTVTDGNVKFTEYDNVEVSTDTPSSLRTICSRTPPDLQQEAYGQLQLRESVSELQHEAHKSQGQNLSLQSHTSTTPPPIDRCLLLIRSNSSRKVSDFNPSSPPIS